MTFLDTENCNSEWQVRILKIIILGLTVGFIKQDKSFWLRSQPYLFLIGRNELAKWQYKCTKERMGMDPTITWVTMNKP